MVFPIKKKLEKAGYSVSAAYDGVSGLEKAFKEKPDMIMVDLVLPKKDGLAVITEIKNHPVLKNAEIVILTNLTDEKMFWKARRLGVDHYLVTSNFLLKEVVDKIKKIFKHK